MPAANIISFFSFRMWQVAQRSEWSEKNRDYFPFRGKPKATGYDFRARERPEAKARYGVVSLCGLVVASIIMSRPSLIAAVISAKASFKSAVFIYTGNSGKLVLFLLKLRRSRVNFAQEKQLAQNCARQSYHRANFSSPLREAVYVSRFDRGAFCRPSTLPSLEFAAENVRTTCAIVLNPALNGHLLFTTCLLWSGSTFPRTSKVEENFPRSLG